VGRTGIEQSYETILRGVKGYNIFLRDVHNKIKSNFAEGKYDKEAVPGKNITASIDAELQQYVESLMVNKVGSVVAIEPSTGDDSYSGFQSRTGGIKTCHNKQALQRDCQRPIQTYV